MPQQPEVWVNIARPHVCVTIYQVVWCKQMGLLIEYQYPSKARIMRTLKQFRKEWMPQPPTSWERILADD